MNLLAGKSLLCIGRVVKTQGTKGHIKVSSGGGDNVGFSAGSMVYLEHKKESKRGFTVESFRPHKGMVILSLRGVKRIEEAEELVGCSVYVDTASLKPLPPDEFYWYQLKGLRVQTEEGTLLGILEEILPTGSNDVFVVRKAEQEILLPATDEVVARVDLKEKVMFVHLLEGLLPEDDF
ncbi:MAG TPA: ribosome maturation factor RimM [Thermodesulfobacteriota bacterium]|nr:ribosome maturation factor RimM [Thermodesulfobacteriota bacterium]